MSGDASIESLQAGQEFVDSYPRMEKPPVTFITAKDMVDHFDANPDKKQELEAAARQLNNQLAALAEFQELQKAIQKDKQEADATKRQMDLRQQRDSGRKILQQLIPASTYHGIFGLPEPK